ncbi:hypothetical protein GCM10009559_00500 [Pseudonocardia zijingensis]|uniref:Uncharacterized protein n=1 Tax=Pseudonocardia zijingensis TaxID=153376 RepID=A0ABP3ZB22_9PSEU
MHAAHRWARDHPDGQLFLGRGEHVGHGLARAGAQERVGVEDEVDRLGVGADRVPGFRPVPGDHRRAGGRLGRVQRAGDREGAVVVDVGDPVRLHQDPGVAVADDRVVRPALLQGTHGAGHVVRRGGGERGAGAERRPAPRLRAVRTGWGVGVAHPDEQAAAPAREVPERGGAAGQVVGVVALRARGDQEAAAARATGDQSTGGAGVQRDRCGRAAVDAVDPQHGERGGQRVPPGEQLGARRQLGEVRSGQAEAEVRGGHQSPCPPRPTAARFGTGSLPLTSQSPRIRAL